MKFANNSGSNLDHSNELNDFNDIENGEAFIVKNKIQEKLDKFHNFKQLDPVIEEDYSEKNPSLKSTLNKESLGQSINFKFRSIQFSANFDSIQIKA